MMIYGHARNDSRQPDPQGAIPPKLIDAAEASHKCFLDNIFGVNRVPGRSYRDLHKKGATLAGGRLEIRFSDASLSLCPIHSYETASVSLVRDNRWK